MIGAPGLTRAAVEIVEPGRDGLEVEVTQAVDLLAQCYDLHQPYLLFVGTLEPRKNLPRLARAATLATQAQIGAFLMAMRFKMESVSELAAFTAARSSPRGRRKPWRR